MRPAALLIVVAGCSSATDTPDAGPDGGPVCGAPANYGTAVATEQRADAQDGFLGLVGALEDTIPDVISLELYEGAGVFDGAAIAPGVYAAEDQYADCGVCVAIYADYVDGAPGSMYLATSATVTLTSVTGRLTGTIAGARFVQVTLDDDLVSTPRVGGCETLLASLSFDAEINR